MHSHRVNSLTAPSQTYAFAEDIRLVVWDLDETFWRGTLTEGGIEVIAEYVAIVRALAERGVISSICSKNDLAPVRDILTAHDVWRYFVFPDISWAPKGPRVQALIEQAQLRAASVLFIDDNPTNLAEVARFAPGVNLADETVIPRLLDHPQLAGKPDPDLTRLQRYKQMETRKVAQDAAGADPSDFLRASQITVTFEYDVATHLPRVIELINRTNQLNYTKSRVSEDPQIAAATLLPIIEAHNNQCALIRVRDAYGDHGFCGFYIYNTDLRWLSQFCFSCRILGLGVEQWVYEKLDRPPLGIVGEVLSDPNTPSHVDWINQDTAGAEAMAVLPQAVTVRGGCEMGAVGHYFRTTSRNAAGEYPFVRNSTNVRLDHTVILHQALRGITPAQKAVAAAFGFEAEDFQTRILDTFPGGHAVVLSFANDIGVALMRHKASGFIAPPSLSDVAWDGAHGVISPNARPEIRAAAERVLGFMGDDFEPLGPIGKGRFQAHVRELLDKIPASTQVFILCAYEGDIEVDGVVTAPLLRLILINRWTRQVARGRRNVSLLRMEDYADGTDALGDHFHFKRLTYYRIFVAVHAALATGDLSAFKRTTTPSAAARSVLAAVKSAPLLSPIRAMAKRLIGLSCQIALPARQSAEAEASPYLVGKHQIGEKAE